MEVKWFAAYRNGGVDADTDEAAEYSREGCLSLWGQTDCAQ